jgi:hypothetical protein
MAESKRVPFPLKKKASDQPVNQVSGQVTVSSSVEAAKAPPNKYVPESRQGKKGLTGYFDPAVLKQLKILSAEKETSQQQLIAEALNDLFVKNGKPPIA